MRLQCETSRYAEWRWHGRNVLHHRHVVGFDHLGAAQQQLFRFGNGFHDFTERADYEVVWPKRNEPLVTPEVVLVPLNARAKDESSPGHVMPPLCRRLTIAQQDERLPDLHRESEPVACAIQIKPQTSAQPVDQRVAALWNEVRAANVARDNAETTTDKIAALRRGIVALKEIEQLAERSQSEAGA